MVQDVAGSSRRLACPREESRYFQAGDIIEARRMDLGSMLFQGWPGLFRTVVVGALAYVTLALFLRISGKRTLAKLNAFDLVVTGEERQVLLGNATGKDNARRGGYPRGWRAWHGDARFVVLESDGTLSVSLQP
jgi:hypothetical protein